MSKYVYLNVSRIRICNNIYFQYEKKLDDLVSIIDSAHILGVKQLPPFSLFPCRILFSCYVADGLARYDANKFTLD